MLLVKDHNRKLLIAILQPENLARMKQGDPVTIPDLNLMICFEEIPTDKLVAACENDPHTYLTRGWQEHPDDFGPAVNLNPQRTNQP